ncbi:MAG: tetratricopeptide repeat protein [Cyanobacteria bacterium REEB67]|nr:tetratricopeptide repeat protein [Cyanobacteria bacterium REEB67]
MNSAPYKVSKQFRAVCLSYALTCFFLGPAPSARSSPDSKPPSGWREALQEGDRRLKLQELDLAEGCFRQALRQVKKDRGSSADDLALCQQKLAALLQDLDISEEAIPLYKKAIKTLSRAHGKDSPSLISDLLALGTIDENDGDFRSALPLYERAAEIAREKGSPAAHILALCWRKLGHLAVKDDRLQQAEGYYRSALSLLLEQNALPDSENLEAVIADYCDLLEKDFPKMKNLPSAVNTELLKDRLSRLEQKRGVPPSAFEKAVTSRMAEKTLAEIPAQELAQNVPAQTTMAALPTIPEINGSSASDYKTNDSSGTASGTSTNITRDKINFYERMVAVDIKSLGPDHPSVARDLSGLSAIYMADGQYDRAKFLLMRALRIYEKVYGADSSLARRVRAMLMLVNDNQTAQTSGSEGGNSFVADLPRLPLAAQKIDIAIRLNYLAFLCYTLGKVADAEKFYSFAVADIYYCSGDQNLLLAAGLNDYARVLRSGGDAKRAGRLEEDARAIKRKVASRQVLKSVQ